MENKEREQKVKDLAKNVSKPESRVAYPTSINSKAKQSLFDNLDNNLGLVTRLDTAIRHTKKADWKTNRFKKREVENAIREEVGEYKVDISELMELIMNQPEYD